MRPKWPSEILDHYHEDEYFVNNAATGLWCSPKRLKVHIGPAVFGPDYKFVGIREWLLRTVDVRALCGC
jgi:hypothetical protein